MTATTSTSRQPFETSHPSETVVEIPFHGSCSRCHHFHINHQFTFSLDSAIHTRFNCERCNHPIFGLGRASTQNTLASVESGFTFTPRACVDRLSQQQQQQPTLHVETVPGTSGPGLTTITERRSPAPSRSPSNIRTLTPTPSAASVTNEEVGRGSIKNDETIERGPWPKSTAQENSEDQVLRPQIVTIRRLRTIGRRFKRRFCAKPRLWKFPRIIHRASIITHPPASPSTTEVSSSQERPDNAGQLAGGSGDDTEDRHASLRARRRSLTLARERELASSLKCECSPDCACSNGSHVVQVDRAETPEIHVPRYIFGPQHTSTDSSNSQPSQNGAQRLDFSLSHVGEHFDSSRRSSSADDSSSAADSGRRRLRFSQGSTLWSNVSSVSLRARRPPVGRASSMPAVTRAQFSAGFRTGLQTSSLVPGSGWLGTARAATSLDNGTMPGRTSRTGSSQNREVFPLESSVSLSNLPNNREEEQLVNGVSPASSTPMPNGDEITPTPHSGIALNRGSDGVLPAGSDGLSSALQDLASHDRIDHDVPSPEILSNHHSG